MTKLCFVISNITLCGGSERMCLLVSSELCRHGYDVHILSLWGHGKPFFDFNPAVKIHFLNSSVEERLFHIHPKYVIMKLRLWCIVHKPSIIIDAWLLLANTTLSAIKGMNVKHVVWDNFSYEFFKEVVHEQIALLKVKENGSHLVTLTARDRELFVTEQEMRADHVHHIPNPLTFKVNMPRLHNGKMVLSVGRFAREKGFDMLLKAWKIVEQQTDDWTLEIWGDTGDDSGNVHETYQNLQLKRASLHSSTPEIHKKYEEASIYVLPSRHEGFGLVLLEASAYSLPLIAFDCPNGPREIVENNVNGYLIEPENVEDLANAIIRMIRDEEGRKRMGGNAFQISKRFSLNKIVEQWQNLLEGL